jgi:hypothetical protein
MGSGIDDDIQAESLRDGDIVFVAGRSVFSRLVRLIEGTSFDHCVMIGPPDPAHPKFGRDSNDDRTNEIWAFDIGFFGGRHQPLSAYDDVVEAMAVRRHRSPFLGTEFLDRAKSIVQTTKGYAWDRLMFLSIVGATRWSSALTELGPEQSSALVRAMYEVLAQMRRAQKFEINGQRRICTEVVVDSFDYTTPANAEYEAYHALTVPSVLHEGLLWWAAGMDTFEQFIATQPPPRRKGILDEDLALAPGSQEALQLVHEAAAINGVSFPGFAPTDDVTLKTVVIDEVRRTLGDLVNESQIGQLGVFTDSRRTAWFLLDTMMRHRVVVTPADLVKTKSLIDVGYMNTLQINWRAAK